MSDARFRARLRLRIEQFAPTFAEPAANLARIRAGQQAAAADGVDLLVTPELAVTGYDLRDLTHALARPASDDHFPDLADGPDVVLGLVERGLDDVPYNVALHLRRGEVLHRHRKIYLPTYGMFQEGRYFGRGSTARVYDAGGGWRIGLLVCEDFWHPALTYLLALGGANLIVVQAAGGGRGGLEGGSQGRRFASWQAWEHLACAAAIAHGVYIALANRVGVEGSVVFAGGSMIIAPNGEIIARGDDLDEDTPTGDLSLQAVRQARQPYAHIRDEDPHLVSRELGRLLGERA